MSDYFDNRAREAAESCTPFTLTACTKDLEDKFVEGAQWARAEMQAENLDPSLYLKSQRDEFDRLKAELDEDGNGPVANWKRNYINEWAKHQQTEKELKRLKELVERDIGSSAYDVVVDENERLKTLIAQAAKHVVPGEVDSADAYLKIVDDLKAELAEAKGEILKDNEEYAKRDKRAGEECARLKLMAESLTAENERLKNGIANR